MCELFYCVLVGIRAHVINRLTCISSYEYANVPDVSIYVRRMMMGVITTRTSKRRMMKTSMKVRKLDYVIGFSLEDAPPGHGGHGQ